MGRLAIHPEARRVNIVRRARLPGQHQGPAQSPMGQVQGDPAIKLKCPVSALLAVNSFGRGPWDPKSYKCNQEYDMGVVFLCLLIMLVVR